MPLPDSLVRLTLHRYWRKATTLASLVYIIMTLVTPTPDAHKEITSKYNYDEHVFPIFRDRCGRCHIEGGPAPMSLMTYTDAVPWAESIREQLMSQKMPPWYADTTGPAVRGGHTISTKELDILITWAAGGTPQSSEKAFTGVNPPIDTGVGRAAYPKLPEWDAGPPDLILTMKEAYTLSPGTLQDYCEFIIPTGLREARWIGLVDFSPGKPSMVRDAVISLDNGPVLAAWVPGHHAIPPPSGVAFKLPSDATLRLQIHYKKHWQDEQIAVSDRSSIGLYFGHAPLSGRSVEAVTVSPTPETAMSRESGTFTGAFPTAARVVAVRPRLDKAYAAVNVEAVLSMDRRVSLLKLRAPQPEWYRRYWLQDPIEVPRNTTIEVTTTPAPFEDVAFPTSSRYPLQIDIDYVPMAAPR